MLSLKKLFNVQKRRLFYKNTLMTKLILKTYTKIIVVFVILMKSYKHLVSYIY